MASSLTSSRCLLVTLIAAVSITASTVSGADDKAGVKKETTPPHILAAIKKGIAYLKERTFGQDR